MWGYAILAIVNGVLIAIGRTLNGYLSAYSGAFKASLWNHIVGLLFLFSILILLVHRIPTEYFHAIPSYTLLGGVFGALFVALNSYVFTRLGAMKTIVLVIGGQMIAGVLIDHANSTVLILLGKLFGVGLIVLGVYMAKKAQFTIDKD